MSQTNHLTLHLKNELAEIERVGEAVEALGHERGVNDVAAPLPDKPIGGLGIHLVRTLMDRLEYKRAQERNVLLMTKKVIL